MVNTSFKKYTYFKKFSKIIFWKKLSFKLINSKNIDILENSKNKTSRLR